LTFLLIICFTLCLHPEYSWRNCNNKYWNSSLGPAPFGFSFLK